MVALNEQLQHCGVPISERTPSPHVIDGLENWRATGFTPVGGSQTTDQRNHNYVNEITQRTVGTGSQVVFQYDGHTTPTTGNGNLTSDSTLIYAYDAFNRLIQVNRVSDGLVIGAYVYDAMNRRVRKTITNGGLSGNIPDGSTDYIYLGNQVMEERGSSNAATRQYVWGNYLDECVQLTTFVAMGSQNLEPGSYYLLQDLLYRAVALTDSSGTIAEAYDTDAYGNTLIFTAPGADGNWWGDYAVQSGYGANEIIYCGYRYDPESDLYYVRNRTYNPALGRWIQRDPIGYSGGINLYEYVNGRAVVSQDPAGLFDNCPCPGGVWEGIPGGNASVSSGLIYGVVDIISSVKCATTGSTAIVEHAFNALGVVAGFGGGFGVRMSVTGAPDADSLGGGSSGWLGAAGIKIGIRAGVVGIRINVDTGAQYSGIGFALGAGLGIPVTGVYLWGNSGVLSTHCKCKK